MNNLLALDLSTTVMGYSVFDKDNGNLIAINYYSFQKDDLVDRGFELFEKLNEIFALYGGIKEIAIEERLKSFRAGGTNADAMLKTAQLNFLCQYLIKNQYHLMLTEINVNTARSSCFPGFHKIARATKGVKQKEIAFKMVKEKLGEHFFPTKVMKSGPRKGETVTIEEAKDMADSWVIGQAAMNIEKNPSKTTKKKK